MLIYLFFFKTDSKTLFVIAGCCARRFSSQLEEKGETTSSDSIMAQLHVQCKQQAIRKTDVCLVVTVL